MAAAPCAIQEQQERTEAWRLHHKVPLRLKPLQTSMTSDMFPYVCIKQLLTNANTISKRGRQ